MAAQEKENLSVKENKKPGKKLKKKIEIEVLIIYNLHLVQIVAFELIVIVGSCNP